MSTFHHGTRVTETTHLGDSINDIDSSVIGVICTADDADDEIFPLDTPVLLTRVASALGKAGTTGTLLSTLTAISNQCSPKVVVIRVAEAANIIPDSSNDESPTQDSLVIGGQTAAGRYTGMYAWLTAIQTVGVRPRILAAPGLDTENVSSQLQIFAQKLRGFAYVSAYGCKNVTEAKKYASNLSGREIMVIWPDFQGYDSESENSVIPATAIAVGLRAKIDATTGWHKSISNVAVNGVTGITQDVYYSLQDTDSDTDALNQACVTTLIKRDGFRFWGNRTRDEDTYIFEVYTRTAQILADTVAEAHAKYVDGPLTPSYAKAVVDGVNQKLAMLTTAEKLLGGTCWYDTTENSKGTLGQGKVTISYNYTPVPPAEDIEFIQDFTDSYLGVFDTLASSTHSNN